MYQEGVCMSDAEYQYEDRWSRVKNRRRHKFRLILFVFVLPFGSMLKRLDLRVR